MQQWATFATVAGGAAAGLTGLLFVAVSIRLDVIGPSQELRNRAAQVLSLFVTVLFISIALAIPGQAYGALGAELIVISAIAALSLIALDRRARAGAPARHQEQVARLLHAVTPTAITTALLLISGVVVALGIHAGLYIAVLPVVTGLAGGVVSAWLLMTKIGESGQR